MKAGRRQEVTGRGLSSIQVMTGIDHTLMLSMVLEKLFPHEDTRATVTEFLDHYGKESYHREAARVRLAILKLSGSDLDKVGYYLKEACKDYRDVLAWAEYPAQMKDHSLYRRDPEKFARLVEKDHLQYEEWLSGLLVEIGKE